MELKEILEVVKSKYPNAICEDKSVIHLNSTDDYNYIDLAHHDLPLTIWYKKIDKGTFCEEADDIIELKNYLDVEITWEDLLKEFKEFSISYYDSMIEWLNVKGLRFYKDGTIEMPNNVIATNRSYWQIFNIIKNLVE